MSETKKRVVPPFFKKLLDLDSRYTQDFVLWANKFMPLRSLRVHYKALEISCHGIPWLMFWIAFTWLFNNESLVQTQVNMILGLIVDILLVAVIKAYVRRRRPAANVKDSIAEIGPDAFSFPSGHASRAVFITYFFINLEPVHYIFVPPLLAWSTSICLSRVLLNRHHLLDVVAGVVLGLCEGVLIGLLWVDNDTAKWMMNYLSDEKNEGGEYHV